MPKLDFLGAIGGPKVEMCISCGCQFEEELENCPECNTGPYCDDCLSGHLCGEDTEEDYNDLLGML